MDVSPPPPMILYFELIIVQINKFLFYFFVVLFCIHCRLWRPIASHILSTDQPSPINR